MTTPTNTQITDESVKDFINWTFGGALKKYLQPVLNDWEKFKSTHSSSTPSLEGKGNWFLRVSEGQSDEPNGFIGEWDGEGVKSTSPVYKWFPTKEAAAKYWEAIGYALPLVPVYLTQPQIDKLIEMLGGSK